SRGGAAVSNAVEERQESELRAALARQRAEDLGRQLERAQQVLRTHGDELAQRRAAEEGLALQPALINEERRRWLERAEAFQAERGSRLAENRARGFPVAAAARCHGPGQSARTGRVRTGA